jgi:hypothetical protein
MSADRGRLTHTPSRRYREVVSQQGRVLLEADWNEGQRLLTEGARETALDVVGPTGTPDDGYLVTADTSGFAAGAGTMYVGGVRLRLDEPVLYAKQREWLDTTDTAPWGNALWRDPAVLVKGAFAAVLLAREQEITAVEDPALRDVALGGPDTAARTRLLQRLVAIETKGTTCAAGQSVVDAFWSGRGLVADAATARLTSRARLQVSPETPVGAPSPCDPPTASGFLGADNQLIRVQVAAFDQKAGTGTLVWGYHNGSVLYRAYVQSATTIRLTTRPMAPEFEPRSGQVVQILARAAVLGDDAFAAALTGHFAKLTTAYAADSQTVTLPGPVPQPPYHDKAPVFVRLWEDRTDFTPGKPVSLTGIGLQVTITANGKGPLHVGDYWSFAVRPLTPNQVYPERFSSPQPPDGPRLWTCSLAFLNGNGKTVTVADDCRQPFDNLVELTARRGGTDCACTVCVTPEDHKSGRLTLQAAIDTVITQGGGTVCLEVGQYDIEKTVVVAGARSLRLSGKGPASLVRAKLTAFEISKSDSVALTDFALLCDGADEGGCAIVLHDLSASRVERLTLTCRAESWAAIGLGGALADVAIEDNHITSGIGITDFPDEKTGATGLLDVRVERNQLACERVAVSLANVTVHQRMSRIAANRVSGCKAVGFRLVGATVPGFGVEVIGNELEIVGDGIEAGVDGLRILDNDLKAFDPDNKATTARYAILLWEGGARKRLDNIQISGNRIAAFKAAVVADARLGALAITGNHISADAGVLIKQHSDSDERQLEAIIVGDNRMTAIRTSAVSITGASGRTAVTGNQLDGGVDVDSKDGDCVFSHNHCTLARTPKANVHLNARTLVMASNRIVGGTAVVLRASAPAGQSLCTVVGNIISPGILLDGAPLAAPWVSLNVIG